MNKICMTHLDFSPTFGWRSAFMKMAACALAMTCLFSCIPDPLEVDNVPKVKPVIVVSSQIIPNQSVLVLLTQTIGALEASDDSEPEDLIDQIAVNDAIALIEGPDGVDTLFFLGRGLYGASLIPFQQGAAYTLKVKSESLGEVKATTIVREQITFSEIEAELYVNGFNDTLAQINYTLADPQEENYYMINVQEVEREDAVQNLINPRAFTKLVRDNAFNGQEFGEQFRVFDREYNPGDTIAVSLFNINEDYFQFMKQRVDNRFSLIEFLGEPVNYPSNVEGGKGFFNLCIPDVRFFILEQE